MLRLAEHAHQLVDGDGVLHRDDVGARHHDVLDRELAEAEDIAEHGALLRAERVAAGFLAAGERVLDHLAQIRLFAEAEPAEQALEPGRFLFRRLVARLAGSSSSASGALLMATPPLRPAAHASA